MQTIVFSCTHQEHSEDGSASGASGAALHDGTSQEAQFAVAMRPRRAIRKPKRLESPADAPMTDTDSEGSFSGSMDDDGDDCDDEEEAYLSDGGTEAHLNTLQQPLPDPPRGAHKDGRKSGAKAHPAEMMAASAGTGKRAAQRQAQLEDDAEEVTFVRRARSNGSSLADAVGGNPHSNTAEPPPGDGGASLQAPYDPMVGPPQPTGGRQGRRKRTAGIPQVAQPPLPSPAPQLQAVEPQQEHQQSQQALKRQHQSKEVQQALEEHDGWEQLPPARVQGATGCDCAGGPMHVFQARHEAELAAGNDMVVTLNLNLKPKEPVGATLSSEHL